MARMKISAGSPSMDGPLCLYDENGDAVAMISSRRRDKESIALAIVDAVNANGGIDIVPLPQGTRRQVNEIN